MRIAFNALIEYKNLVGEQLTDSTFERNYIYERIYICL